MNFIQEFKLLVADKLAKSVIENNSKLDDIDEISDYMDDFFGGWGSGGGDGFNDNYQFTLIIKARDLLKN